MASDFVHGTELSLSKNISSDIYISVKTWFGKLDPGQEKLKSYREGIEHTLNRIQIMGMSHDRKITNIYISLKFFPDYRKSLCPLPEQNQVYEIDEKFSTDGGYLSFDADTMIKSLGYGHIVRKNFSKKKIKNADNTDLGLSVTQVEKKATENAKVLHGLQAFSFIDDNKNLVVLGQPGGGKTTFLKYLALSYTGFLPTAKEVSPLIPIFLPLRDHSKERDVNRTADWFLRFATRCSSEISTDSNTNLWIENQLESGNCLILVDGIDEVPSEILPDILSSFRSFSNKYRKNKFVVTCRSASYQHSLEGFRVCEVDDFDENDIKAFSNQWFGTDDDKKNKLVSDIKKSVVAKELCKTPLLMTMMCLMYEYNRRIPENRFELYESCIDALMYKWDTFRSIDRSRRILDRLSNTRKRYILSNIARKTFDAETLYIRKHDLLDMLSRELEVLDVDIVPDDLLYDFEGNMGMLVERAQGVYCFSHLTFHEFFSSLSYLEHNEIDKLFDLAFNSPRYREVFLLSMEKLYAPDRLGVMLAGRIKHLYLNNKAGSTYHSNLLADLLLSQAVFSKNIRILLKEIYFELELYSDHLETHFSGSELKC